MNAAICLHTEPKINFLIAVAGIPLTNTHFAHSIRLHTDMPILATFIQSEESYI